MDSNGNITTEAEAYLQQGVQLAGEKRHDEAIRRYNMAIMLAPGMAQAYYLRGLAIAANNKPDEALRSFLRAVEIDPGNDKAHAESAAILHKLSRFADAASHIEQAIHIDPLNATYHNNMGLILNGLCKTGENQRENALACFEEATRLAPGNAEAWNNRGIMLQQLRRYDEALTCYDTALKANPELRRAKFQKSTALLLQGKYEEAWPLFEYRTMTGGVIPLNTSIDPMPIKPGSLTGKKILLVGEQGRGDVIQFSRYATMLGALGADVTLQVHAPLVSLLSTLAGVARVIPTGKLSEDFDYYYKLMSLPGVFGTMAHTIPANIPYLSVDPVKSALWQKRLGPRGNKRIGLVWEGSALHPNNHNRSASPAIIAPLLNSTDAEFYSLNKESNNVPPGIVDLTPHLRDFTDTAALISELDLVITVDTAVAHLAGALGKPVWIMIAYAPDYRWLAEGDATAWYPTAKLFRQKSPGDWAGVIAEVAAALRG